MFDLHFRLEFLFPFSSSTSSPKKQIYTAKHGHYTRECISKYQLWIDSLCAPSAPAEARARGKSKEQVRPHLTCIICSFIYASVKRGRRGRTGRCTRVHSPCALLTLGRDFSSAHWRRGGAQWAKCPKCKSIFTLAG